MSNSVTGASMDSQARSITVYGYFDVHGRVIKENLIKRHPELDGQTLNIVPGVGKVKIDNHSDAFPEGAQATLTEILEPYRKPAPQRLAMPLTLKQRGKIHHLRLMKEWV
jgi:hypothetical protein